MKRCSTGSFNYESSVTNRKRRQLLCVPQAVMKLNRGKATLNKNAIKQSDTDMITFVCNIFMEYFSIDQLWVAQTIKSTSHINCDVYPADNMYISQLLKQSHSFTARCVRNLAGSRFQSAVIMCPSRYPHKNRNQIQPRNHCAVDYQVLLSSLQQYQRWNINHNSIACCTSYIVFDSDIQIICTYLGGKNGCGIIERSVPNGQYFPNSVKVADATLCNEKEQVWKCRPVIKMMWIWLCNFGLSSIWISNVKSNVICYYM